MQTAWESAFFKTEGYLLLAFCICVTVANWDNILTKNKFSLATLNRLAIALGNRRYPIKNEGGLAQISFHCCIPVQGECGGLILAMPQSIVSALFSCGRRSVTHRG